PGARARADRAHRQAAAVTAACGPRPRPADEPGPGPRRGPPRRGPAQAPPGDARARAARPRPRPRRGHPPDDASVARDRRRSAATEVPAQAAAAPGDLRALRRVHLGHLGERLLPLRPPRPPRRLPQAPQLRVHRAGLRGHGHLRARTRLRRDLGPHLERGRGRGRLRLHGLRARLAGAGRADRRRPRSALDVHRARRRAHQRPRAPRRRLRPDHRARRQDVLAEPRAPPLLELRRLGNGCLRAPRHRRLRVLDNPPPGGLRERRGGRRRPAELGTRPLPPGNRRTGAGAALGSPAMGGRRVLGALAAAFALAAVLPAPAGARGLPARCDPLDPAACLLPWPNDYFTVRDPATPTGRRLHLQLGEMPRNRFGVPINPADYNRSDGFSPGQEIITKVPGLTSNRALQASGAPTVGDIGRYADPGSPIVVIDADTLERQPIFGEVDANPPDPADRVLTIRPAVDFKDGGHYIVALRNLVRADGTPIKAQLPFRIYRDDLPSSDPAVEARRPHMEHLFDLLGRAGIDRHSLYLAWDFTVASR